jgi:hypothetical protein
MKAQCTICKDEYAEPFIEDFENGICLPCQANIWNEQWNKDVEDELLKLNAKLGTSFDFDSFCYDCWVSPEKLVTGLSQSETPILYEVYLRELENKEEYYGITTQLKLL